LKGRVTAAPAQQSHIKYPGRLANVGESKKADKEKKNHKRGTNLLAEQIMASSGI